MSQLQGALGPVTFTKSPYGPIAKTTPTDVQQPNSPAQRAATGRFTLVGGFWKALSVSQRLAWSQAAGLDRREAVDSKKSYRLSGYGYYSSLSNVWLNAHNNVGTPPSSPPTGEYAGSVVTLTATAASGHVTFTGSGATPAGTEVQFELQALPSASRKPSKEGYRVAAFGVIEAENEFEFPVAVKPGAYAARYAFVETATGRRTGFVEIPVTGVALALEQGGAAEKPAAAPVRAKKAA